MTNRNKMWQCPSCPHRASRRGNMKLHVLRWHGRNKEPVYLGEHNEFLLKSKNANHQCQTSIYSTLNSESFLNPFRNSYSKRSNSPFGLINSYFDDILEVRETRAKAAAIKNTYNSSVFHYPQFYTNLRSYPISPGYYGKTFVPPFMQSVPISSADKESSFFITPPAINSQRSKKEELTGFKARICENCSEVIIEARYEVEESGNDPKIIARNEHACLLPLKTLKANEMTRLITNLSANLTKLPWELKKAVKGWTGQQTFLIAFKLPFDKVNTEDIADIFVPPIAISNYDRSSDNHPIPYYEEKLNEWALRVRKNGSITLSDNDLIDFITIAKNKTWGYFRIHVDALKANKDISNSKSEIYCMFINKRPLPTPEQQIVVFSPEQPQQAMPLLQELHKLLPLLERELGQVLPEERQQMIQFMQRQFHQGMELLTPRQRQHLLQILPQRLQQILLSVSSTNLWIQSTQDKPAYGVPNEAACQYSDFDVARN